MIKQWYQSLTQSEQRLLLMGSGLVILALGWVLIYQPVTQYIDQQVTIKNRLQQQLNQMQSIALNIRPNATGNQQEIPVNQTFSSWLDQQLQSVNLQQTVNRTEPIDSNTISVWLQGAPFNQVVDWLQSISSSYGVEVEQIDVSLVDQGLGLTDIRMRLVK